MTRSILSSRTKDDKDKIQHGRWWKPMAEFRHYSLGHTASDDSPGTDRMGCSEILGPERYVIHMSLFYVTTLGRSDEILYQQRPITGTSRPWESRREDELSRGYYRWRVESTGVGRTTLSWEIVKHRFLYTLIRYSYSKDFTVTKMNHLQTSKR